MEFIKTFRERQQTKRQEDIRKQSEELITISDFADKLYIAYNSVPLVLIEPGWTTKEMIEKLTEIRNNYINSKTLGIKPVAAVF